MKIKLLTAFTASLFLFSCGEDVEKSATNNDKSENVAEMDVPDLAEFEFYKILINMPTPLQELSDMNVDEVAFKSELLAPVEIANQHESKDAIALNCGIYIVDMVYQAVYHENKNLLLYTGVAHELSEKVGLDKFFDDMVNEQMKAKLENKDSLQFLVEKGLETMEQYLVDNKQLPIATQLLIGSWVETQYLLTQSILEQEEQKIAEDLKQHIFAQREHLANLLLLIHEVKDEAGLHDELAKLETLEASFTKIHESSEVNHDILVEVAKEIAEIRNDLLVM